MVNRTSNDQRQSDVIEDRLREIILRHLDILETTPDADLIDYPIDPLTNDDQSIDLADYQRIRAGGELGNLFGTSCEDPVVPIDRFLESAQNLGYAVTSLEDIERTALPNEARIIPLSEFPNSLWQRQVAVSLLKTCQLRGMQLNACSAIMPELISFLFGGEDGTVSIPDIEWSGIETAEVSRTLIISFLRLLRDEYDYKFIEEDGRQELGNPPSYLTATPASTSEVPMTASSTLSILSDQAASENQDWEDHQNDLQSKYADLEDQIGSGKLADMTFNEVVEKLQDGMSEEERDAFEKRVYGDSRVKIFLQNLDHNTTGTAAILAALMPVIYQQSLDNDPQNEKS